MTTRRFDAPDDLAVDQLYASVADADLQPLWMQQGLMPGEPPLADRPYLWRWKTLRSLAERSGALIPIDRGGDRRVLALCNPGLGGAPYATQTLWGAVQYLNPGEVAPAHHHTPGALRFVLEGAGVWTLVDGDPVSMAQGDLVLTPGWAWHEHHNPGDTPMLWFDGLDIPMVRSLDAVFFEDGPDQMTNRAVDPVSRSERKYATAPGLVPIGERPAVPHSPLMVYRWADTDAALGALLETQGETHVGIRFTDPTTGRDVMPTLRCEMHRFFVGARTPTSRRVGSSLWVVFRGAGTAVVAGQPLKFEPGDVFAVPSWAPFDLEVSEPTDLFALSDAPVLEALGLARSVTLDTHQDVLA